MKAATILALVSAKKEIMPVASPVALELPSWPSMQNSQASYMRANVLVTPSQSEISMPERITREGVSQLVSQMRQQRRAMY